MSETRRAAADPKDAVRLEFRLLPLHEILRASPRALLGVTPQAEEALRKLDVTTVFDLATSAVFTNAAKLVAAGADLGSLYAVFGAASSDVVREERTAGTKVDEVQFLGIDALAGVPEPEAAAIGTALDVTSVRDLALYPPFRTATEILTQLFFPDNGAGHDPERPADLVPRSGEYPTERVQYTTLLMDAIEQREGTDLVDVVGDRFSPLDLKVLAKADSGFQTVAFGALLTFDQSWYAQGVTLGQLLHSTSLAPGESTRVAVLDWSRRTRAAESELVSEQDELENDMTRNRSISEVTRAVATDAQSGFSRASANSTTTQAAGAWATEAGGGLLGLLGAPSMSAGGTLASSSTWASSDSYASSFGRRDVSSQMMQAVNDRTHQHAHSSRSRRASVVKEVAQSEHENVSTRVLANYNHMHALTIQYYEVVQIYRVEVALAKAERVIFIPVRLIDFTDDGTVRRFRAALSRAALTWEVREALENLETIEIRPDDSTTYTALAGTTVDFVGAQPVAWMGRGIPLPVRRAAAMRRSEPAAARETGPADAVTTPAPEVATLVGSTPIAQVNHMLWSTEQAAKLSALLNRAVLHRESMSIFLPTDVTVEGVAAETGGTTVEVVFHRNDGTTVTKVSANEPLALSTVTRIGLRGSSADRPTRVRVVLTVDRNGVRFPLELPEVTIGQGHTRETPLVVVDPGAVADNLQQHLTDNRAYYSQAVLRSLDATQIALLLSGFGVKVGNAVVPVAQVVDPVPVRYVGNYLAFTMSTDAEQDSAWAQWLDDRGIKVGGSKFDIVPLGTGGTFAEAVLGRSNSAEKLDITRFWDWQDSPIPLQPTEIAAISTGSRATGEDTSPGQLGAPIINIAAPAGAPDPIGTAAVLQAVQNGSMFRDMSGLAGTVGLAQAALQASAAGAASAGQQAGQNMDDLLRANTERQRIAAEMVTSLARTVASAYTGGAIPAGGGISGGGSSQQGAKINYFDRTAGTGTSGSSDANGSTGGGADGAAAGGSGGSGTPVTGGAGAASGTSYSQNPAALGSLWGDTRSPSQLLDTLVDKAGLDGPAAPAASSGGASTAPSAWPNLKQTVVLARIQELAADPNRFQQGGLGLCTAAAFYHHVLQLKPAEFTTFATALYRGGMGFLGKLKVAPGRDLRRADLGKLTFGGGNVPPQADWMVMAALRDSENWFFDFEGGNDEDLAIETSMHELSEWYEDTGFWSDVSSSTARGLDAVKAITKTDDTQVALWIYADLVSADPRARGATHIITVEGPLTIDEGADSVSFDYWTWGSPVATLTTKLSTFVAAHLGTIVATR